MGLRIAVTGASGFLGAHLVQEGRRRNHSVLGLDKVESANAIKCDILDQELLCRRFEAFGPELILHAAARTDLKGTEIQDYRENTDGTRNVIDAAKASGARRIIHFSSRLVFRLGREPQHIDDYSATTPYGISKALSEGIVRAAEGIQTCIVRPTSIWGPGFGTPYRAFFEAVRRGVYLHPRGRIVWKDFGYVENAVDQVFACLSEDGSLDGQTYWLKDPPIELGAFAATVARHFGVKAPRTAPLAVLSVAATAGSALERLRVEAPITRFRLQNLLTPMTYKIGDTPALGTVNLDDGVKRTCEWIVGRRPG
jgi:nucleoside-diphosphate-sugar epimerase